jgi:hypothetical protein
MAEEYRSFLYLESSYHGSKLYRTGLAALADAKPSPFFWTIADRWLSVSTRRCR